MHERFIDHLLLRERKKQEKYQAPYFELDKYITDEELGDFIRNVIPENFKFSETTGNYDAESNVLFRHVHLPNNSFLRRRKVKQIQEGGTDKTSWMQNHRISFNDGSTMVLKDRDTLWCSASYRIWRNRMYNGLLVYDGSSENGLMQAYDLIYTFRNPNEGNRALLAIIGLTK